MMMMRPSNRRVARSQPLATPEGLEPRVLLSSGLARSIAPAAEVRLTPIPPPPPGLFIQPEAGRAPIVREIAAARRDIRVGICNLSDPRVGDALIAAVARGVRVRVIVDRADYLAKAPEQVEVQRLRDGGVEVHLSNPVFPQSFPKYLLIDQRRVVIMTLCLVSATFEDTRDYGLALDAPRVFRDVAALFETDWAHSAPPGATPPPDNPTPPFRDPRLIVAPVNATERLARLITRARRTLDVTSEIVADPYLEGLLIAAANRGVRVRLIAPEVARTNHDNGPALRSLAAEGVSVRVTIGEYPAVSSLPYMHAKTMIVDGRVAYLGSIDLDATQTRRDRELGLVFSLPGVVLRLRGQFQRDWNAAAMLV
jgi:phosphatidylserine/phosphatidylglycerophosphate/cardiolipin synthase-like enzyme